MEQMPATLTVRQVEVQVHEAGFRTESLVVVTTLVDAKRYPRQEIAALYRKRWLVELDIEAIKVTLGMDVLRCKTPEMVRKEIWTCLLAYNLIRRTMLQAAARNGLSPRQLSFATALQTIAASWMVLALQDGTGNVALVLAQVDRPRRATGRQPSQSRQNPAWKRASEAPPPVDPAPKAGPSSDAARRTRTRHGRPRGRVGSTSAPASLPGGTTDVADLQIVSPVSAPSSDRTCRPVAGRAPPPLAEALRWRSPLAAPILTPRRRRSPCLPRLARPPSSPRLESGSAIRVRNRYWAGKGGARKRLRPGKGQWQSGQEPLLTCKNQNNGS